MFIFILTSGWKMTACNVYSAKGSPRIVCSNEFSVLFLVVCWFIKTAPQRFAGGTHLITKRWKRIKPPKSWNDRSRDLDLSLRFPLIALIQRAAVTFWLIQDQSNHASVHLGYCCYIAYVPQYLFGRIRFAYHSTTITITAPLRRGAE